MNTRLYNSVNNALLQQMMNRMCDRAAYFMGESFLYNWESALREISEALSAIPAETCRRVFGQLAGWMVFDPQTGVSNIVSKIGGGAGLAGNHTDLVSGVGTLIVSHSMDESQLSKGVQWATALAGSVGGSPLAAIELIIFRQETDCSKIVLEASLQFTRALAMVPLSDGPESLSLAERLVDCHAMALSCSTPDADLQRSLVRAYLAQIAELHRLMVCQPM